MRAAVLLAFWACPWAAGADSASGELPDEFAPYARRLERLEREMEPVLADLTRLRDGYSPDADLKALTPRREAVSRRMSSLDAEFKALRSEFLEAKRSFMLDTAAAGLLALGQGALPEQAPRRAAYALGVGGLHRSIMDLRNRYSSLWRQEEAAYLAAEALARERRALRLRLGAALCAAALALLLLWRARLRTRAGGLALATVLGLFPARAAEAPPAAAFSQGKEGLARLEKDFRALRQEARPFLDRLLPLKDRYHKERDLEALGRSRGELRSELERIYEASDGLKQEVASLTYVSRLQMIASAIEGVSGKGGLPPDAVSAVTSITAFADLREDIFQLRKEISEAANADEEAYQAALLDRRNRRNLLAAAALILLAGALSFLYARRRRARHQSSLSSIPDQKR